MDTTEDQLRYYFDRKEKYWRELGRLFKSSDKILPQYLESIPPEQITGETKEAFDGLLSRLPYIGGDDNPFTFVFVSSAAALAYIRVLEKYDLTIEEIGELLNKLYEDAFTSLPWMVKWYLKWSEFSNKNQNKLRAFAEDSQLRKYPGNWVMEFVEGDGDDFDFGCNYTECAVLKLYREMNAERYMPYICVMDFSMSRALKTGLFRTTTLHYGGNCCDFRYKKNQLGPPGLPIENLLEYKNRRS